ncbi:MAG: phosphatidylcholine/phosphatidylserine synthase [Rhizobiales bacterium]|nr:phosphatidylcholine/phosphatidylserine synthase [Hyphomicrobiales bacterium]
MDEHAPQLNKDADAGSFRHVPARYLWPNLLTLLALCSGITAIRLGIEQRYELAVGAVMFAIVLDALDGRLARLIKGTSRFGAELDSLADFVNFGVAPAILIYLWALNSMRPLGWIVALMHAICCALRLARFNVALDDGAQPHGSPPSLPAFQRRQAPHSPWRPCIWASWA